MRAMSRLTRVMACVAVACLLVFGVGATVAGARTFTVKLPKVTLIAPGKSGGGPVPTFKWKKVSGASKYELSVTNKEGRPVWAWEGTATRVNLGGFPGKRTAGQPGPVITKGCKWFVAAFDASGKPVAFSGLRAVSP